MEINMTVVIDSGNSKSFMRTVNCTIMDEHHQETSDNTEEKKSIKEIPVVKEKEDPTIIEEMKLADEIIKAVTSGPLEVAASMNQSTPKYQMPIIERWDFDTAVKNTFKEMKISHTANNFNARPTQR